MSGNTFGTIFRITTWGESHGRAVGVVVDGCPAGLALVAEDVQKELDRRRPGQSIASTQRKEKDKVEILSGIFEDKTTGTPISMIVWNKDADSSAYEALRNRPRPGHADYAYQMKYGLRDHRGGGRASARETVGRVAAGAIAKKLLREAGIEVVAYVTELGGITAEIASSDLGELRAKAESNPVRCPDPTAAERMMERLDNCRGHACRPG
jgi:chorismate synthase